MFFEKRDSSTMSLLSKVMCVVSMIVFCISCVGSDNTPITNYVDAASNTNYIISTKAIVNIYDYASQSSDVVQQVEYGNMINAQLVEGSDWAKVYKGSEVLGYIESKHIEAKQLYANNGSYREYRYFNTKNPANYLIFILLIIAVMLFINMFTAEEILPSTIQYIALPIISFIYFKYGGDPLWVCRPSVVGWLIAVPCFIAFVMLAGLFLGSFIGGMKSILGIISYPVESIISILLGLLAGAAMMQIVAEIIVEFTWVIILLMIGASGSSRTYIGTFTDRYGNEHDVFEK